MQGARRGLFVLVVAVLLAACNAAPTFVRGDTKAAAKPKHETVIGEAAVLDRSDLITSPTHLSPTTTDARGAYPPGVSFREVDGIEIYLDATKTRDWHQGLSVELALSLRNRTNRPIGYLTDKESHFAIVDDAGKTLWSDDMCHTKAHGQLPTGFLQLKPGEAVTIADYYPARPGNKTDGCVVRSGPAVVQGWLTVCRDLPDDWMCPAGRAERLDAKSIPVRMP